MSVGCVKNPLQKCNNGPDCCTQDGAKFGIRLENGCECDKRLGLPTKESRKMAGERTPVVIEPSYIGDREGYNDDDDDDDDPCSNWNSAFTILIFVFIIAFAMIAVRLRNTPQW